MKVKPLTISNKIQILELFKTHTTKLIAVETGFSISTINFYRRKYRATCPKIIDRIIKQLIIDEDGEEISLARQAKCSHNQHFSFNCPHCRMTLSEKDSIKIMAIINKYHPEIEKIRFEQMI